MAARPGSCIACKREASPENPVLPGLFVYIHASVPVDLCVECFAGLKREPEPVSVEDLG